MLRNPYLPLAAGAVLIFFLALLGGQATGPAMADRLSDRAAEAISDVGGKGVIAHFESASGQPSRHATLSGGKNLSDAVRDRVAKTVAALPGVGGVRWTDGSALAESAAVTFNPQHCQQDVEALLRARSIRFEESSARIDAASRSLVDEVATALRPCLGSIIAITGHTDSSGTKPGNLALSQERADAVRRALIRRGIPADGLRARGLGSAQPVEGLDPADPANRRIDFSVLETVPIKPTPVDTPGPQ